MSGCVTPYGSSATNFVYNALGQRVEKYTGSAYTEIAYDAFGNQIGTHNRTTWGTYFVSLGGRPIAKYQDNKTYFLHPNHLGSTTMVTDQTGATIQKTIYYPWGQVWASSATVKDSRFASMDPRDSETANDPTLFRMYQPRLYRWLSPDPLAGSVLNPQSLNRYAYVLNNPMNLIDPLGGPPQDPCDRNSNSPACTGQPRFNDAVSSGMHCYIDGSPANCGTVYRMLNSGIAVDVTGMDTSPRPNPTSGQWEFFGCSSVGCSWGPLGGTSSGLWGINVDPRIRQILANGPQSDAEIEILNQFNQWLSDSGMTEFMSNIRFESGHLLFTVADVSGMSNWMSTHGFAQGGGGMLHAGQLGVGLFQTLDFRTGFSPSVQVTLGGNRRGYMDVDRFNPYGGLVYAVAHFFGEVVPWFVGR